MAATTLMEFATADRDFQSTLKTQTEQAWRDTQEALRTRSEELATHLRELGALEQTIADGRAALAVTTVPADVIALNDEIKSKIVEWRRKFAAVLQDRDAVGGASAEATAAKAAFERASLALAAAEKALADATKRQQDWERLIAAVAQPPLSDLQNAATAAQAGILADAKTAIDVLTTELVGACDSGYARETGRLTLARTAVTDAETALGSALGAARGAEGAVELDGITFWRAERALRRHVQTGASRLDYAVKLLEGVRAAPLLTTSQETAFTDAGAATDRSSAATKKDERDDALSLLDEKEAALAGAILTAQAADPTGSVDTVPEVQTARTARDEAKTGTGGLDEKQAALDAERATLDDWLVIAPDSAWAKVRAFQDAEGILTELAATNSATLVDTFGVTQQALVHTLEDTAQKDRAVVFLQNQLALREALVTSAETALEARTLSAVRGDG